jgi:hypothetical protein
LVGRWVGLILIVLGWIQAVPLLVGWIGFGIAGTSFILETIYKKNIPPPRTGSNQEESPEPMNRDEKDS